MAKVVTDLLELACGCRVICSLTTGSTVWGDHSDCREDHVGCETIHTGHCVPKTTRDRCRSDG